MADTTRKIKNAVSKFMDKAKEAMRTVGDKLRGGDSEKRRKAPHGGQASRLSGEHDHHRHS